MGAVIYLYKVSLNARPFEDTTRPPCCIPHFLLPSRAFASGRRTVPSHRHLGVEAARLSPSFTLSLAVLPGPPPLAWLRFSHAWYRGTFTWFHPHLTLGGGPSAVPCQGLRSVNAFMTRHTPIILSRNSLHARLYQKLVTSPLWPPVAPYVCLCPGLICSLSWSVSLPCFCQKILSRPSRP